MSNQSVDGSNGSDVRPQRVAVLGYGEGGRDLALRLRKAGHKVTVGLLPAGMSWVRAVKDGFAPTSSGAAVASADVVVVLVPDEDQTSVYWRAVEPNLASDALVVFVRGNTLYAGTIEPCSVDVVLVTPSERAGCRVAVHHDATGKALERAIAYARTVLGDATAPIGTTSVTDEVEAELEERPGGHDALLAELDKKIARARDTHEADEAKLAFYEGLRSAVARRRAGLSPRSSAAAPSSPHVLVSPWTRTRGVA